MAFPGSNDGLEWLLACPAFGMLFDSSAFVRSPRGRVLESSREVGAAGSDGTTDAGGIDGSDAATDPSGTADLLGISADDNTDGVGGVFLSQAASVAPTASRSAITAGAAGRVGMDVLSFDRAPCDVKQQVAVPLSVRRCGRSRSPPIDL